MGLQFVVRFHHLSGVDFEEYTQNSKATPIFLELQQLQAKGMLTLWAFMVQAHNLSHARLKYRLLVLQKLEANKEQIPFFTYSTRIGRGVLGRL